jgi:hypothetical protein
MPKQKIPFFGDPKSVKFGSEISSNKDMYADPERAHEQSTKSVKAKNPTRLPSHYLYIGDCHVAPITPAPGNDHHEAAVPETRP